MFSFSNIDASHGGLMAKLAAALKVPLNNNRITLPESVGNGYLQLLDLPNGLQVMIADYSLNTAVLFDRPSLEEEVYTLRFETLHSADRLTIKIDGESLVEENPERSVVYLTCSNFEFGFSAGAGTYTSSVSIRLTPVWMSQFLHMETYERILEEYCALKTQALLSEPQIAAYTILLDELKRLDLSHPAAKAIAHNRTMELVELFFTRLYAKRNSLQRRIKISAADVANLRKVEAYIREHYQQPLPSIDELSRIAAMSATKLKSLFKSMYEKPVYQYYQFYRMSKARAMLTSGKYSVKETALTLGYSNFSNFTNAFRKVFNVLPGDLLN